MTALLPPNVKVHLALGYIDMHKGIDGFAMLVQGVLHPDLFTGHLFVFRGGPGPTSSRLSIGMALASACSQNGSASFCGPSIASGETLSLLRKR
jgi:transposase